MAHDGVRSAYLAGAEVAAGLIAEPALAERWAQASVLEDMSCGALASHLARSLLQVGWFLDAPEPDGETITAVGYIAPLRDTQDRNAALNQGVMRRAEETAALGPQALAVEVAQVLPVLRERLAAESPVRRIAMLHRPGQAMLLDEYLRTRCMELAVHIDDLALSLDRPAQAPGATTEQAIALLVEAARARHGDLAVLRALTRRERDDVQALRVF